MWFLFLPPHSVSHKCAQNTMTQPWNAEYSVFTCRCLYVCVVYIRFPLTKHFNQTVWETHSFRSCSSSYAKAVWYLLHTGQGKRKLPIWSDGSEYQKCQKINLAEDWNCGGKVRSLRNSKGRFNVMQGLKKKWHRGEVLETVKLNMKILYCCPINFDGAIRKRVG